MSLEDHVNIRYLVFCGKLTPHGILNKFEFREQAPASLCTPHTDNQVGPDPDATRALITSIVKRHNDEIMLIKNWRCVMCGKRAKELLHSAVSLLSPNWDRAPADFEPTVVDNVAPICISGGACDREAEHWVNAYARSAQMSGPSFEALRNCDKCGKKSGVKLCGGCKDVT